VNILDLIDQGTGHAMSGAYSTIDRSRCCRDNCRRPPEGDHAFCAPCLEWVRDESRTVVDPLGNPPPQMAPLHPGFPDDDEGWQRYLTQRTGRWTL
jgi:hypothetical protein